MRCSRMMPLESKIPHYELFAFDIETTGKHNEFLMGSIVGKKHEAVFWDKDEMIDFIMKKDCLQSNQGARIFATNLSFDLTALFHDSKPMESMDIVLRGSKIIQATLPSDSFINILFWDTMNYYPYSVKKMGQIVGIPKLDMPDYIKERRMPREDEKASIEAYNLNDSMITMRFAEFLQDSFNKMGCKMRMTAASTALDLFKRKYLAKSMFQERIEVMMDEYNAYYGGRVEVFKRGLIRDANYYDFNSLYPSVMRNEYPDVSSSHTKAKGNLSIIDHYEGISEVSVLCPHDIKIPFLPYRQDHKLLFPTGSFKGFYSHAELRHAIGLGYQIFDVGKQIYYTNTHHPFRHYVEDLYSIRKTKKEACDPSELVIKLMMNSLYGKFGQKLKGESNIYHINSMTCKEIDDLASKGKVNIVGDFIYFESDVPDFVATHIMPIYAIYTTAYGRIKLYEAMKDLNPIYCDTDSIITHEDLTTSGELGDLKLEYRIKEGIMIRPKMYAFKTEEGESIVRIKGNHASASWDYDRFKEFIANPKVSKDVFCTFKKANRMQIPYNTIMPMEKEFGLEDTKRAWESLFDPLLAQMSSAIRV